ncbi:MAG: hypothetical protein ABJC10_03710 [Acidobacteriota bacterium]
MKMRTKVVLLILAASILTMVIALPGIIEAKRLNANNETNSEKSLTVSPVLTTSITQNQKGGNVTVGASIEMTRHPRCAI